MHLLSWVALDLFFIFFMVKMTKNWWMSHLQEIVQLIAQTGQLHLRKWCPYPRRVTQWNGALCRCHHHTILGTVCIRVLCVFRQAICWSWGLNRWLNLDIIVYRIRSKYWLFCFLCNQKPIDIVLVDLCPFKWNYCFNSLGTANRMDRMTNNLERSLSRGGQSCGSLHSLPTSRSLECCQHPRMSSNSSRKRSRSCSLHSSGSSKWRPPGWIQS